MDCHLENTHWSLLGFFKHKSLDDWMEQLFKHEGICVWEDEQYAFMKNAREAWPQGCTQSGTTTDAGDSIYYDVQPISGGGITLGLYTDTACVEEYESQGSNDPITVENVLGNVLIGGGSHDSGDGDGNYDFSSWTLAESLSYWDTALSKFKQCQPCVAYDLQNYPGGANEGGNYGDDYSNNNNNNGDTFDCYDDADYTNVNQCMKFMAKTTMNTATFRDVSLGRTQGTLLPIFSGSGARRGFYRLQSVGTVLTYIFTILSFCVFGRGLFYFLKVRREVKYQPDLSGLKQALAKFPRAKEGIVS